MSTTFVTRSSWISSLSYFTAPNGTRYLAVFTREHSAFVFANVPSYLPGLIAAGVWKQEGASGHFSPGRAFHRFLRSQSQYTRVYLSTREQVQELNIMIWRCENTARQQRNAAKRARRATTPRETRIRRTQEMRVEAENAMAWS